MTTPAPPAIAATGLRRSFGDHVVLDGIDLTVAPGTMMGEAALPPGRRPVDGDVGLRRPAAAGGARTGAPA